MSPELLTSIGIASALFFSFYGSAMASAVSGTFLNASPCKDMWKAAIPIVISGVLAIYGLIIATLLAFNMKSVSNDSAAGYKNLAAGLSVGFACLFSGLSMVIFLTDVLYNNYNTGQERDERETASPHVNLTNRMQVPLLTPTLRTRNVTDVPVPTVRFCMVLVFLEAIGLYGFIVALLLLAN